MYLKENITQQEIADRVGVSRVTVNKWAKEWEGLKLNLLQTREERISSTLTQLDELDRSIAGKARRRANGSRQRRRPISGAS